jgi:hypothetical protein
VRPPFNPDLVTEEFADLCRKYRISRVWGDRYAGEWVVSAFNRFGIRYSPAERTKSELYVDLLPLLNSRAVDLLDHDKMVTQLVCLERKTARGGRDSIDHPPGGHDDVANAVAGSVVLAMSMRGGSAELREVVVEGISKYDPFAGIAGGGRY